ncbi:TetR/AcrR family transcriptional regulator C-terminal domain-containing protein [Nocardia puris]|uniref:TetR family transcriptional regulator n=1 Tax=Nocardia puris TaxID=208602 RepID=A0A366D4H6_9NOCA|nr:TetR/AcrR family transcriptional regulator [Nocardia puris]MBF6213922.1 TetR/AcrR family transcriptional regulator C-terminal domain-containing protein [Nocardia puris]MBF6368561.1 TetR/AcrR family transcriptional regulator C-terminal domain-containing protein [Nocardia puris]MBF6463048.1 TetR/AcrR family transcriptional regulator C-terminal domain-containing protein [Nocardia puris]RBO84208.1 TetR family transcriptional regulator [Nocardia puris]
MAVEDAAFGSVWARPQRRRRDQPALSREQIVAAAIDLLSSEGIDALSMRKLGAKLNAGATSLYTHVANKEEIIELVADQVIGELAVPDPADPRGWRGALLGFATELRALILRHPWMSSVFGEIGTLYLGPNMMRSCEGVLSVLHSAGFDERRADNAMNVLMAYVIGITSAEAASVAIVRRSGMSMAAWIGKMLVAGESAARPFPHLHRRYVTKRGDGATVPLAGDAFVEQVEMILDGIDPGVGGSRA